MESIVNPLVKIENEEIGGEKVNSVNARELWEALEVKQKFADWITKQIKSLGFEENIDFIAFHLKVKSHNQRLPQKIKEYILTLDVAKHISMASRTQKGKEVRNYFIKVEKQLLETLKSSPSSPIKINEEKLFVDSVEKSNKSFNHQPRCRLNKRRQP